MPPKSIENTKAFNDYQLYGEELVYAEKPFLQIAALGAAHGKVWDFLNKNGIAISEKRGSSNCL